jgi:hypothetical protein
MILWISILEYLHHVFTRIKDEPNQITNNGEKNHIVSSLGGTDSSVHMDKVTATVRYSGVSDNRTTNSHAYRPVIIVIGVILAITTLTGFIMSGGLVPTNNEKAAKSILIEPLNLGEVKGRVISHNGLSAIGATVVAYQKIGFSTSTEEEGGYTAKSSISTDSTFSFNLPSGVYDLIVFYYDGRHDVVKNYAIWPNTSSSFDFNYQ